MKTTKKKQLGIIARPVVDTYMLSLCGVLPLLKVDFMQQIRLQSCDASTVTLEFSPPKIWYLVVLATCES